MGNLEENEEADQNWKIATPKVPGIESKACRNIGRAGNNVATSLRPEEGTRLVEAKTRSDKSYQGMRVFGNGY